jgi:dTDP-4-amino-4,6-dideoxygalactose transaminase
MSYYKKKYGYKPEDFPNSIKKYYNSFSLPIYPSLGDEQIERIIKGVISIGKKFYINK